MPEDRKTTEETLTALTGAFVRVSEGIIDETARLHAEIDAVRLAVLHVCGKSLDPKLLNTFRLQVEQQRRDYANDLRQRLGLKQKPPY